MADETPKEKAPKKDAPKKSAPAQGGGKGKDRGPVAATDPAPKASEGKPRLQTYYEQTVRPRLQQEFGLTNPHEVPRVLKVVLNVGMGDASKNPKQLEAAAEELGAFSSAHVSTHSRRRRIVRCPSLTCFSPPTAQAS